MPNARCVITAPHAVLSFRDTQNACHGNRSRLAPATCRGGRAAAALASLHLSITRLHADLTFSFSHLLGSPCTPHATRPTPDQNGVISAHVRRVVQQRTHAIENKNQDQNSFRATRHAPNVMQDITHCLYVLWVCSIAQPYERTLQAALYTFPVSAVVSSGWYDCTFRHQNVRSTVAMRSRGIHYLDIRGHTQNSITDTLYTSECTNESHTRRWRLRPGEKGQQRERVVSEAKTVSVEQVVKRSSEAVPLHGTVCSKQRKETPREELQHRVAGRFVSARSAYCGVSRPTSGTGYLCPLVPTLCTLLISSLASSARTDQALQKISFKKAGLNEPFLSVLRSAASKPHFSKYISRCSALPDGVAVAVVVQPHTTKSLTGGVLRTVLLGLSTDRSLVGSVKGLVMSVVVPKLSSIAVPADDETSVKVVLVMQPLLLTVEQVAQVLNFSRSKVYEFINVGDLPVLRFGRSVRVRVSALEQWLNLQEEKAGASQLRKVA